MNLTDESATFEDLCLKLERDFPGSPAAALLQRFYELRRYTSGLATALETISARLVCSQGYGKTDPNVICYCPNCGRGLSDARSVAMAALAGGTKQDGANG